MWVAGRGELKGQLVVVSGPSGCGKSTLIRRALARPESQDLQLSVSATTRPRRPGEQDGVDYHFLGRDAFDRRIAAGEFLEWAEYNDHRYGTPAAPVFEALAAGKSVLLEIEVNGAIQVRKMAPASFFVFIRTECFRILEQRLLRRGTETEASLNRRLIKAREELAEAHWYDVQLINDDLDGSVEEFLRALRSNGCGGGISLDA
jgi:guanylate kinase